MPSISPVPVTVRPLRSRLTSAPMASRMSRRASPACVVCCGQSGTRTRPPETRAAARNGGVGEVRFDEHVEQADLARLDPPGVRLRVVDDDARVAKGLDGHRDVRLAGNGLAVVMHGDALVVAGAGQQQRGDELRRRGRVQGHRPAADRTGAVDDDGERAATAVVEGDPERTQRVEHRAHRAYRACGSPSNSTRPSASAATGGRNRITVPARPTSTRAPPWEARADHPVGTGGHLVHRQTRPVVAVRRDVVDLDAEGAQPVGHEQGVARAQRLAQRDQSPASAARTRSRLVSDLLPGSATVASTGSRAVGAAQSPGWLGSPVAVAAEAVTTGARPRSARASWTLS